MQYEMMKRLLAPAIALLVGLLLGWHFTSLKAERDAEELALRNARATLAASEDARNKESALQAIADARAIEINRLEKVANENLLAGQTENSRLRNCIASGTCGLRYVNAPSCGTSASAGQVATSGAGDGTAAELDSVAGQAYFALREGIQREAEKLRLCQGYINTSAK